MHGRTRQLYGVVERQSKPLARVVAVALLPMIGSWVAMALALPNGRARYGLLLATGLALLLGFGLTALMAQRYPDERYEHEVQRRVGKRL